MITDEQKAKLTKEQITIAEKWEKETQPCSDLFAKLDDAAKKQDQVLWDQIMEELGDVIPTMCEHGHAIGENCMDCDAIEIIIRPELFDDHGNRKYDIEDGNILTNIMANEKGQ
jgi:hypothetical protein